MRKTKEEILAAHEGCTVDQITDSERILIGQDVILPAMEEYARQEAIGYLHWALERVYLVNGSLPDNAEQLYTLYLTTK